MRSIGQLMADSYPDMNARLEGARRRLDLEAEKMRRVHGPDFDVEKCWYCGGLGTLPGDRGHCDRCEYGLELSGASEYDRRWKLAIPSLFRNYRFASHPRQEFAEQVLEWFHHGSQTGQNLYLGGPVGTGKTGLAIAALWAAHQAGRSIRYYTVPDMLSALRPGGLDRDEGRTRNDTTMFELQTVELLLMDDLGAEKPTVWTTEQLYQVVNGRYHHGLPTIVTTNLTPQDLRDPERVGRRIVSRLMENTERIWMDGDDLRNAPRSNQ